MAVVIAEAVLLCAVVVFWWRAMARADSLRESRMAERAERAEAQLRVSQAEARWHRMAGLVSELRGDFEEIVAAASDTEIRRRAMLARAQELEAELAAARHRAGLLECIAREVDELAQARIAERRELGQRLGDVSAALIETQAEKREMVRARNLLAARCSDLIAAARSVLESGEVALEPGESLARAVAALAPVDLGSVPMEWMSGPTTTGGE